MDSILKVTNVGFTPQEIKDFLKKPVIVQSGSLSNSDTVSSFAEIILPKAAMLKNVYYRKLTGYLGIKCSIVLRLQVNATKFQQGRYFLAVTMLGGANINGTMDSTPGRGWINAHANTIYARTQLPRVEVDLNCDTEGVIKIPYVSALNYVPMGTINDTTNYGNVCIARLYPYSKLEVGSGSTDCKYTIWCHLEDVELIGAAAPQSGNMFSTRTKQRGGKSVTQVEQDSVNIGPISSTMARISKAASYVNSVPFIGDYANTLGWAADIAGKVASAFGWSKPINLSHGVRVNRTSMLYFGNVDTPDNSLPVSLSCKNEVSKLNGFSGTSTDELDLCYMASIPALYKTIVWSTSDVAGANIVSINVRPLDDVKTRVISTYTVLDYIPMQFVADHFQYWRGSMVYTIKFVKTEFHSGRLAIAFYPEEPKTTGTSGSYSDSDWVAREIVDIRECNTVTLSVPYTSSTPYRPVLGNTSRAGYLGFFVVDPLISPNTVPSTVTMLIEASCGPDIEFAVPINFIATPVFNVTPQSGDMFTADVCALEKKTIGNTLTKFQSTISSEACIGEKILSWRSLLKSSFGLMASVDAFASTINIIPFGVQVFDPVNEPSSLTKYIPGDIYTQLGSIFLLSRGSVRCKFISSEVLDETYPLILGSLQSVNSTPATPIASLITGVTGTTDIIGNSVGYLKRFGPRAISNLKDDKCAEFQIPQYLFTHSRNNVDHCIGKAAGYNASYGQKSLLTPGIFVMNSTTGVDILGTVFRSGADDINFGTFVSIPPMLTSAPL